MKFHGFLRLVFGMILMLAPVLADDSKLRISATLLQGDICKNWSDAAWDAELVGMRQAQIEILVLQHYEAGEAAKGRLVERCIAACERRGISYYLGLSFFDRYAPEEAELAERRGIDITVARDVLALVKKPELFLGWYVPLEIHGSYPKTTRTGVPYVPMICEAYLTPLTAELRKLTPDRKIMIAPFTNTRPRTASWPRDDFDQDAQILKANLTEILSQADIDIVAPQDGMGTDKANFETLPGYFRAMREAIPKDGETELWATIETMVHPDSLEFKNILKGELEKQLEGTGAGLSQLGGYPFFPRPLTSWLESMSIIKESADVQVFMAFAFNPYILRRSPEGQTYQLFKKLFYQPYLDHLKD